MCDFRGQGQFFLLSVLAHLELSRAHTPRTHAASYMYPALTWADWVKYASMLTVFTDTISDLYTWSESIWPVIDGCGQYKTVFVTLLGLANWFKA